MYSLRIYMCTYFKIETEMNMISQKNYYVLLYFDLLNIDIFLIKKEF